MVTILTHIIKSPTPHCSHCPSAQQDAIESVFVFSVLYCLPCDHPTLCVLIIMPLNPLIPPFTTTIPSPFLESVSLLLFCSFSFALLLYSTNKGNHLVFVFFRLAYFTEHNTLQLHPCCCKWQDVFFLSQIIFHCVYVPPLYPFIY